MGLKVNDLREKVGLARIYVPPYVRVNEEGHVEHVDGYWRTIDLSPDDYAPYEVEDLALEANREQIPNTSEDLQQVTPEVSVEPAPVHPSAGPSIDDPSPSLPVDSPSTGIPYDYVVEVDSLRELVEAPMFGSGQIGASSTGWAATKAGATHIEGIEFSVGQNSEKPYDVSYEGVRVSFVDKQVAADYAKLLVADDGSDKPTAEHLNYLWIVENRPERLGLLPTRHRYGQETWQSAIAKSQRTTARDQHLLFGTRETAVTQELMSRLQKANSLMARELIRADALQALDEMKTRVATRLVRQPTPTGDSGWWEIFEHLLIQQMPYE